MYVKMNRRSVAASVFGASAAVGLVMPGSFLVETAGPAIDVTGTYGDTKILSVSGVPTHPSDTSLFMTTVSAYGTADMGVSGVEVLRAIISRDAQSVPVRALYSKTQSADSVDKENAEAMTSSQRSATALAAEKAGYTVTNTVKVASVSEESPAYGRLVTGDVLTAITVGSATTYVTSYSVLTSALAAVEPGTNVTLTYTRDGQQGTADVTTTKPASDSTGWARSGSLLGIGVSMENMTTDVKVSFGVKDIGGPSAGMMFSLAIYDALTAGSLGGDHKIAGTGTIAENGEVGPIGGIVHKIVGARAQGAEYFLAPATNCAETVGYEPDGLTIFAVHTFDDAVAAANAIASGDTSKLTTCAALASK